MAKRKDPEIAKALDVCDQAWAATEGGDTACSLLLASRNKLHPAAVYRILAASPFFVHDSTCRWRRA